MMPEEHPVAERTDDLPQSPAETARNGPCYRQGHGIEVMFIEMEPIDGQYEPLLGSTPLRQIPVTVDMAHDRLVLVKADLR